jgi:hypothetical protein
MNLGKKYLCMDQLNNVLYNKFIDTQLPLPFGSFSCIILLLEGCHIHYSACIFTEKAKHRNRFHFEFLTTFGTLDTTFARQISVRMTHVQTIFHDVIIVTSCDSAEPLFRHLIRLFFTSAIRCACMHLKYGKLFLIS